ncbi:MAG: SLC13 family permease [Candidatus Competibacterales bacterium]
MGLSLAAWWTLAVIVGCSALLAFSRFRPELVLSGGLVVLLTSHVLTPQEALAGLANEGLVTIGLLYVVAAGLQESGSMGFVLHRLLGLPRGLMAAQARLMAPVLIMSPFLNNTPVVATLIPTTLRWAKRLKISPSKLLLPLSYAAILGGTCSLIGTSTNLILNGLLIRETATAGLGIFDIAWVGIPCAASGFIYLLLASRWLPDRLPATSTFGDPREYTVEMVVVGTGPLVGKTVEAAGLREVDGLYLVEIEREGRIIAAVGRHERLRAYDRLVFAGVTDAVAELCLIRGLSPAVDASFTLADPYPERRLVEVVVSPQCPLVNETLADGRFRTHYGASVVAVCRHGQRLAEPLGKVRLQPADTLLLVTRPAFLERHRYSRDFLLVSAVPPTEGTSGERAWLAWTILAAVVALAMTNAMPMVNAAMLGAGTMVLLGCCPLAAAARSINGPVLLAIASAFGLGEALRVTGAAEAIAVGLITWAGDSPWLLLTSVYATTALLTAFVTNGAVAVLMFPVVLVATRALGFELTPFVIAVMMGASASFATPISYQTNLMVYGLGGYRFGDYLRLGLPLNVIVGAITVAVAPLIWSF